MFSRANQDQADVCRTDWWRCCTSVGSSKAGPQPDVPCWLPVCPLTFAV